MTRVLILGGTIEARRVAQLLADRPEVTVITSLAGRTDHPIRPAGQLRIGGFGGVDGLSDYLVDQRIDRVLDATHPFAQRISGNARQACRDVGVPLLVLARPRWEPEPDDRWISVDSAASAAAAVAEMPPQTVLLTIGRGALDVFAPIDRHHFVIRSVDEPAGALPNRRTVILARGPFAHADEVELMRRYGISAMVTKNSGGSAAVAKLGAARTLGVTVVVIDRPTAPTEPGIGAVSDPEAAVAQLLESIPRVP